MHDHLSGSGVHGSILASLFAALTAVGAFIKVPITQVPFTLQDFFVLLSGALLGARYGMLSQTLYLAVGLMGAPIFANGGGIGYVFQPTFGYLLAYPFAAGVVGTLTARISIRGWSLKTVGVYFSTCLLGMAIIFVLGVLGLFLNLNYVASASITPQAALVTGCLVFLPGSAVKALAASMLAIRLRATVNEKLGYAPPS